MFDSILKLIRSEKEPPTSAAVAEAIESAKSALRELASEAETLRAQRIDLVLEGADGELDELERVVVMNGRRIEQAEALLTGLELRHQAALEREADAAIDADVATAEQLRREYAALVGKLGAAFEKVVPHLERMRAIPDELRAIGFRLEQGGAPRPDLAGHPNATLRPRSDPLEETTVLPAVAEGSASFSRDRNAQWFRPDLRAPAGIAVGDSRPLGAYDGDGNPLGDRSAPVGAKL